MTDTTQDATTEEQKELQSHYFKLQEYRDQAMLRTSIGYPNSKKADKELLYKYLVFRGYTLRKNTSFGQLALILLALSAKEAQEVAGLSSMLFGDKK